MKLTEIPTHYEIHQIIMNERVENECCGINNELHDHAGLKLQGSIQ